MSDRDDAVREAMERLVPFLWERKEYTEELRTLWDRAYVNGLTDGHNDANMLHNTFTGQRCLDGLCYVLEVVHHESVWRRCAGCPACQPKATPQR